MNRALKSTLFSLFLLSGFFFYAHAQNVPGISDPVTFRMIPTYPNPNERVDISALSFSTDLNKAVFRWYVNGKLHTEGIGKKDINLMSGAAGSFTSIRVEIATSDFGTLTQTFSFRPAEVTLLWEADTYTPPFYMGKALHSYNGAFKVTAIPEFFDSTGKKINPKDLIYTWKKNGEVQGSMSGFGKDSYIGSQTSYLRQGEEINVEVSSSKENIVGSASITISPTIPEIIFYEHSPLYGTIYEKALQTSHSLLSEEITLRAEPFNMSVINPLSNLISYIWSMNGLDVTNPKSKNELTLRTTKGEEAGESIINVQLQHSQKVLQGGQATLTILQ